MRERFALVVSLPKNLPSLARAASEAGADALKIHLNVLHHASGTQFGGWCDEKPAITEILKNASVPVGLVPGAETLPSEEELSEVLALGIDLLDLYAHHMPASYFSIPGVSRMVAMDCSHPLTLARGLERLGADIIEAAVVPHEGYGDTLSAMDLAIYQELASLTACPLLIPTQRRIEPRDVKHLKAAGVRGIMIGAVVTGLTEDGIRSATAAFRTALDELDA